MSAYSILLICSDTHRLNDLRRTLLREGVWVLPASSAEAALKLDNLHAFDLIIVSGDEDPASIARLSMFGQVLRQPEGYPIRDLLCWAREDVSSAA